MFILGFFYLFLTHQISSGPFFERDAVATTFAIGFAGLMALFPGDALANLATDPSQKLTTRWMTIWAFVAVFVPGVVLGEICLERDEVRSVFLHNLLGTWWILAISYLFSFLCIFLIEHYRTLMLPTEK